MDQLQLSGDAAIYLMGLAATWGTMMWRLTALERKVEKHNNLVERVAIVEQSARSAHKRLDDIKEELP